MPLMDCDAPAEPTPILSNTDYVDRLSFLWPNLVRFSRFTFTDGAYAENPFTDYGDQRKAVILPPGGEAHILGLDYGAATVGHNGGAYNISFYAYIRGGDTAATFDAGFRDKDDAAITGLADQTFSVTATPTLFKWEGISSDELGFYDDLPNNALFHLLNVTGLDTGSEIVVTLFQMQTTDYYAPWPVQLPWRPARGEEDLAQYAEYILRTNFAEMAAKSGQRLIANPNGTGLIFAPSGERVFSLAAEDYLLLRSDDGRVFRTTGTTSVTVQPNATESMQIGSQISGRIVSGSLTLIEGSGVTINPPDGVGLTITGDGQEWRLHKVGEDEWDLYVPTTNASAVAASPIYVPLAVGTDPPSLIGLGDGRLIPIIWSP